MANGESYPRAPIIEAVIELQFAEEPLSARDLDRVKDKLEKQYPTVEITQQIQVQVAPDARVTTKAELDGYKMTAKSATDVVLLKRTAFGSVRLAPYEGWDAFLETAKSNFGIFTNVIGRRKITRLGARYINRIDVPIEQVEGKELTDWVKVGIAIPETISERSGNYSFSIACTEITTGVNVILQSSTGTQFLLDHVSIILDIDAAIEQVPTRLDELWEAAGKLRAAKNSVFENSITNKTRELLQ